nr:MAG TPA: YopX protein [Caudoviricetes sp.]
MKDRYLFKAKRIDNGEWVEGHLITDETDDSKCFIGYVIGTDEDGTPHDLDVVQVEPSTICRCVGLKDKNGKLIWENDICDRKEQYPEIVKYCGGDWTLDYSYASHKESGVYYCNLGFYAEERKCVEVIGNIFDNPELLEV